MHWDARENAVETSVDPGPHPDGLNQNISRPGPGACIFVLHAHMTPVHLGVTIPIAKHSRSTDPHSHYGVWGAWGALSLGCFAGVWEQQVPEPMGIPKGLRPDETA